jgi:hypothetical protein
MSQLHEVRRSILREAAIDGRIPIGSERKKGELGDMQPKFIVQTSDDSIVLEIRLFKHGYASFPSSLETMWAHGVCRPLRTTRSAV